MPGLPHGHVGPKAAAGGVGAEVTAGGTVYNLVPLNWVHIVAIQISVGFDSRARRRGQSREAEGCRAESETGHTGIRGRAALCLVSSVFSGIAHCRAR